MINTVVKRDGRIVEFDKSKIADAILKAMNDVNNINKDLANRIANDISKLNTNEISVEELQDLVEEKLMSSKMKDVARSYVRYRYDREKNRELSKDLNKRYNEFISLVQGSNEEANKENFGYYGKYAKCSFLTPEEAIERIKNAPS